jgi:glyoxylase-like metal-dependent hydrolase (beta-lactamase superfamily II)
MQLLWLSAGVLLMCVGVTVADECHSNYTFAPVPAAEANPPEVGPGNYRVESFGGGAYMLTENVYQVMFLVSTEGVIVVDAPPTIGHGILWGIGNTTDIPITHLVYSHAHADHIGAAHLFGPEVKIIAHEKKHTLKVGNQTLDLEYKGLAHQPGNIFIYAPEQKVLMVVDIVYPGWVPFNALGQAQFVPGYIKAYDQVLEYDFDHLVGGHLTRSGSREDVLIGQEYVHDLKSNCANAIQLSALPPNATNPISAETILPPVQAANEGNAWAVFQAYLDIVSEYCSNVTNEKWLGVLGAADVFGPSNAHIMVESLRIDFDILGPFGVQD